MPWKPASIPKDESIRLQDLVGYGILDTPPEPAFDRIAQLAGRFYDADLAFIAFLDQARQWCKSATRDFAEDVPREETLCSYVVAERKTLVVGDLHRDKRLKGHPTIENLAYSFYAGAPLISPAGQALGTLCILDDKPRMASRVDTTALEDFAAICMDELELRRRNAQLSILANKDPLTGLDNRRSLDFNLDRELRQAHRTGSAVSLLMIDIDHFKGYNDSLGHGAGDEALVVVARLIEQQIRRPHDYAARYGGEEFAVILPDTDIRGALKVGNAIRNAIQARALPHPAADLRVISVSVGAATSTNADDPGLLIDRADKVLYSAKRLGRNRVVGPVTDASDSKVA